MPQPIILTAAQKQNLTRTAADSIATLSDVAKKAEGLPRSGSDSVAISDSTIRVAYGKTRQAPDLISVSDVDARSPISFPRTSQDSLAFSDQAQDKKALFAVVDEIIVFSDVLTSISQFIRVSDEVALSIDSCHAYALTQFLRAGDDITTFEDTLTSISQFKRTADEAGLPVDEVITTFTQFKRITDEVGLPIDEVLQSVSQFKRVTDEIGLAIDEATTAIVQHARTLDFVSHFSISLFSFGTHQSASDLTTISDSIRSYIPVRSTPVLRIPLVGVLGGLYSQLGNVALGYDPQDEVVVYWDVDSLIGRNYYFGRDDGGHEVFLYPQQQTRITKTDYVEAVKYRADKLLIP